MEEIPFIAYGSFESKIIYTCTNHESSRYRKIYTYPKDKTILEGLSRNEKRNLIRNVSCYIVIANEIFWWGLDGTLPWCLEHDDFKRALKEVHEGICEAHLNGLFLAKKIMRDGYYWPTMEKDVIHHAIACKKFQLCCHLIHSPTWEMLPFITHWPFQQWAFDFIGQIYPSSSNGHKFIIMATDYFMKWAEEVPLIKSIGK